MSAAVAPKYGELWERYTQRVRHSMLPFVY